MDRDGVICNWYLDRVLESDLDWNYGTLGIVELNCCVGGMYM